MMIYRDRVEDLYKQWKDATLVTTQDVTAQFLVKSKQRDLNATIRVSGVGGVGWRRGWGGHISHRTI